MFVRIPNHKYIHISCNNTKVSLFFSVIIFNLRIRETFLIICKTLSSYELIFEKYPQYFIDEVEDYIIHHLKLRIQEHESDKDLDFLPKFLHFCSTSKKAFQNLQDILLTYAEEVDYDNRTVNFFSELVYKVHLLPETNPIDLYSPHIQPLIGAISLF